MRGFSLRRPGAAGLTVPGDPEPGDGGPYGVAHPLGGGLVGIAAPRPEEPLEAVAAVARDDVDVEVGDALAHPVVHGDEAPLSPQRLLKRLRQETGGAEQGRNESGREIGKGGVMGAGDQQDVAGEKGAAIKEGQALPVAVNYVRGDLAGDDPAEAAIADRRSVRASAHFPFRFGAAFSSSGRSAPSKRSFSPWKNLPVP